MKLSRRERAREGQLRRKLLASERRNPWPGIAACAGLTWAAFYLQTLPFPPFTLQDDYHPLNAVLLALLLGLAIRNLVPASARLRAGIDVVIKRVLPAGIVLLGARLDFYDLLAVGSPWLKDCLISLPSAVYALAKTPFLLPSWPWLFHAMTKFP